MKPTLHKGQLTTWKDDRGFGFIKPDGGGKEVFLHISALKGAGRRPTLGDTILYEQVIEANGKIRATKASIQGVVPQTSSTKRRNRKGGSLKTAVGVVILAAIALFSRSPFPPPISRSPFPPPITSIMKPGCMIKGNISIATGNKFYHLPGMEDYGSTVIDPLKGERWFCTEKEAIAAGWRKAPR
ncbi:cold shock domain-containing protein [Nostoc sp. FACHB-280]|uniref:cold shock domain-containing protein n=1 Tax=Nostoc sp. FACHB-280 TaxID=2692839 RepID=UPI00168BE4A6|nr:cold shock domain-containing protein [Nostoc sp. FACHB-280]MBD2497154.1 cold shock domain-containing protein [Nostoc sp. FACHB-280]